MGASVAKFGPEKGSQGILFGQIWVASVFVRVNMCQNRSKYCHNRVYMCQNGVKWVELGYSAIYRLQSESK